MSSYSIKPRRERVARTARSRDLRFEEQATRYFTPGTNAWRRYIKLLRAGLGTRDARIELGRLLHNEDVAVRAALEERNK